MTPERYQTIKRVFEAVCHADASLRSAMLDRHCGADHELRSAVESLLHTDEHSQEFLGTPVIEAGKLWHDGQAHHDERSTGVSAQPARVGAYRIIGVLGEGSMGVVYRAEQQNPKREVALKVIRAGVTSGSVMNRFEYEAQLLGRLQHPGIGQIYEAGTANTGSGRQPYLAMELVTGQTLSEYCASTKPPLQNRVELVARICDAVHHAHQKGVLHRDLKPGNIMVDLQGNPKVLDFGVGRMRDADDGQHLNRTLAGQVIGTLGYMSPEQASGRGSDVDTQSDVYALGSILFEALSGQLPLEFGDAGIAECLRRIVAEQPKRLGAVNRECRGDLETIAAKALEKDRSRRYASAAELAEDLRRSLRHEPISARPASTWYVVRTFARRNRAMVGALSVAVLAMVIGAATTTWQAIKATSRGEAAAEAVVLAADLQESVLTREEGGDSIRPRVTDIEKLREISQWVGRRLDDQPLIAAKLENLIGLNYLNLSMLDEAHDFIQRGLNRREAALQPPHEDVAESLHNLGRVLWHQDLFEDALVQYQKALDMRVALHGRINKDVAMTMTHVAACLRRTGRAHEAEDLYRDALAIRRALFGDEHEDTAASLNNLAMCMKDEQRFDEAIELFEQAIDVMVRMNGPVDLRVARVRHNLGACLLELHRPDDAEVHLMAALDVKTRLLPKGHADLAVTMNQIARVRLAAGQVREAIRLCEEALVIQRERLQSHTDTADTLLTLGRALREVGDAEHSELALREALAMRTRRLPAGHAQIDEAQNELASLLKATGGS